MRMVEGVFERVFIHYFTSYVNLDFTGWVKRYTLMSLQSTPKEA